MYLNDHGPPHFHALYGGDEALVGIDTLSIMEGRLAPRVRGLVMEWASIHQAELRDAWNRAETLQPPGKIAPLD